MSWRMIGKPISTAEMAAATVYQTLTMPAVGNKLLKAATAGVIFYNDPAFVNLHMRLYTSGGTLLATSAAWAKADILTLDHAYKSIGFTFTSPFPLTAGSSYRFALYATGYTGDASTHISWRHAYPDPQYREGLTLEAANGDNHPLELSVIGADI
jgi:hypothetical protein